ncbi:MULTISPECIES: hypothetical protein [unclassified Curtobacterium]|uniref:hypothetical protein n=1 Tax=unclassified Curtobacterium TaxID=257496 RepID=UPI0008DCC0A5|nr:MULTISPECIES: hypothetical protein [unclassified Curtobacterium]OIH98635.1 hypothetical protein BIU92_12930 [Curtobacterium sp. MCBA15_003]OII14957.1 hypothetical protein BIU97_15735 [Curtobacterium sp. MCBA15_009]OII32360.1 hypothetical protein BIU94_03260 [Curtobacterium sp. MMLR14_006]
MSSNGNAPVQTNAMGIASLVLGVVGVAGGFFLAIIGVLAGIVGLVLGLVARRRSGGRGVVLAGIILSVIAIVVGIIGYVLVAVNPPTV